MDFNSKNFFFAIFASKIIFYKAVNSLLLVLLLSSPSLMHLSTKNNYYEESSVKLSNTKISVSDFLFILYFYEFLELSSLRSPSLIIIKFFPFLLLFSQFFF